MLASVSDTMYLSDGRLSSGWVKFMATEVGVSDRMVMMGGRRSEN